MGRGRCGPPTPGVWPAAQPVSSAAILGPVFPPLSPLLPPGQQPLENLNAGLTSLAAPACPLGLPDSQWPALRGAGTPAPSALLCGPHPCREPWDGPWIVTPILGDGPSSPPPYLAQAQALHTPLSRMVQPCILVLQCRFLEEGGSFGLTSWWKK